MVHYQRFTRSQPVAPPHSDQSDKKRTKNDIGLTFDWQSIRDNVFAGRGKSMKDIQRDFGSAKELVFVCARKVTGDFHVTMGQMSFIAVVSPAVKVTDKWRSLDTIIDRNTHRVRHVLRGWMGWCTLAYPGFRRPHWNEGLLVKIAPEREGERPGFAFCTDGNQEAIVLSWLPAQDNEPFLLQPPPDSRS